MAGRGPAPKAESIRRNTTKPQRGEWVDLPASGRPGAPPALPKVRRWTAETQRWWKAIWATPEATMWDVRDDSLVRLAIMREAFLEGPTASMSGEMRQIEDRHGMNEKGRRDLRWRYSTVEEAKKPTTKKTGNVVRPERWQQLEV